jgi:acetylornithine/N-succinyldiaminopimelate aminotransferase
MDTINIEDSHGISFSERLPLAFTHGKGSTVWDEAGKSYMDFTSGWGVTCLGHAHPALLNALNSQAMRLIQGPNAGFTYSPERARLLQTMRSVLPAHLSRVYFCNSGAEANDAVLKLARKITGRCKVVSTLGSFHGRSMATLSVSRGPENPARFLPRTDATEFIRFGDSAALQQAIDGKTAALIVEPVQGEGGVQIPSNQWLSEVAAVCQHHGAMLVMDEIQTGFCRTGRFFAHQHSPVPVKPDFMTMAKGIAGGYPFAAFALSEQVYQGLSLDDHGGTYCGNPLGCAVADAVVTFLRDQGVAERVDELGKDMLAALRQLQMDFPKIVKQVRGIGFLCALELHQHELVRPLTRQCAEAGLLVVPTRNGVIRLLPDLLAAPGDLHSGITILARVLEAAAPR